jgi:uncharacterized protein YbjT (DUF2867 family)
MSIVINTPTSNIGRALAARLLDAGEQITVMSRDKKKVDELLRRGARVVEGSFEEPALLAEALEGAEALFWLTPPPARPDYYAWATKCAKQAAAAAKKAGASRAVVVSSMGAHTGPGTGAVGPAREMENDFEAALPAVVSLRPGIFMENFLLSAEMIAKAGQIFVPIQPGKKWPLVATADIAAKAACWLLDRGWTGHHRVGVHGPQDLSTGEAAAIIRFGSRQARAVHRRHAGAGARRLDGYGHARLRGQAHHRTVRRVSRWPPGSGRAAHPQYHDPHDTRRVCPDNPGTRRQRQALILATRGARFTMCPEQERTVHECQIFGKSSAWCGGRGLSAHRE